MKSAMTIIMSFHAVF